ncbi:MAG: hypothetical protein A3G59_01760 [Candidatus Taylorbacteria bacterium RIFCSPLOWO2_12_FULL_47_20]|uniref:Uncharacterized protein n=1 Tax=Candidatus Taylorbacteria bacterium RIFCSPLOWO2_12_FULL_47_20 TaxID=1802335 RepID=A0A1G2PBL3_9BACT|nr:MAG: hypothetical protein A3G59_01760 [Candidatus Taylorbacteria bacterium RIFCSPLOWO2_12_FULL_47_20]
MKLFYVANLRWPTSRAHGIQVAKMCEAFVESGVDLTLVVPKRKNLEGADFQKFYGLRTAFPVRRIYAPRIIGKSRLVYNINALLFALSALFFLRNLPAGSFLYTVDLDQFSFFTLPIISGKVFIECHGPKKKSLFAKFFFKRVAGVIAVSEDIRRRTVSDFGVGEQVVIVEPNGVDLVGIKSDDSVELPRELQGCRIAMYVGRVYDWKGLETLVEAAALLPKDIAVVIVGGTEEDLKKISGCLDLPRNIYCAGFIPPNEVGLWIRRADILLVTATKKNEYSYLQTSPMKLFEYLATGRPIIAAATPAIRSVVSDREVYFYEADQAEDLAGRIIQVLKSEKDLNRESASVEKAGYYSWARRAGRIIDFIRRRAGR